MRKQQQQHQNRRTFRGRGGPTDGSIPPPRLPRVRRKYVGDHDGTNHSANIIADEPRGDDDTRTAPSPRIVPCSEEASTEMHVAEVSEEEPQESPLQSQVQHLQQRIQHNRTAMSQTTVAHLAHYETHVLAATRNTLREWQMILRDSSIPTKEQTLLDELQPQLFGLVQQALQTGPLAGAKPGYCKRCGSEVAQVVLSFLRNLLEDEKYPWTERQHATMAQWRRNAEKAAGTTGSDQQQQPSKSVQKRMNKISKKKKGKGGQ